MNSDNRYRDYEIQYFLLDDCTIARLWKNRYEQEYLDPEYIDSLGMWSSCPLHRILESGKEIDIEEVQRRLELFRRPLAS